MLAVEIMDNCPYVENRQFKLRDELFWFRKPKLLLHLIRLISFQVSLLTNICLALSKSNPELHFDLHLLHLLAECI